MQKGLFLWGSPKASHIKASHPHFPHFPRFHIRIFRIFRVFRVFVLRSLLRPLFSWGGRDVRIFRIFAVSGLNRWFRKSDRPALGWPALGDWDFRCLITTRSRSQISGLPIADQLPSGAPLNRCQRSRNQSFCDHDHHLQRTCSSSVLRTFWVWMSSVSERHGRHKLICNMIVKFCLFLQSFTCQGSDVSWGGHQKHTWL